MTSVSIENSNTKTQSPERACNSNHEIKKQQHSSLHHSLLGPSLLKAGQENVDQHKVAQIIYSASVGSKYFDYESRRDSALTQKISQLLIKKSHLEKSDLSFDVRRTDRLLAEYEAKRDLSQYIVHVDCDAFYASVEELERPELKSLPMAVGKGVITTCNYKAREYGVRSGMAGHIAKKICPGLVFVPLRFEKYMEKAREIRQVLGTYDDRYEAASCDEAYLNITGYCVENGIGPDEVVQRLRKEVKEKTNVTVSAGIAPNVKLAKIASNRNKPDGQFRIMNEREEVMRFMADLPVRKVNGVGRVLERELEAIGITTCADIYPMRGMLCRLFGEKAYQFLLECYLGVGRTKVQPAEEYERKSIGTESTFPDLSGGERLREKLRRTAEELERDLKDANLSGRTLILKIKLHDYQVHSKQTSLPFLVKTSEEIYRFALPLLEQFERKFGDKLKMRLMGLRITSLVDLKKGIKNKFFVNLAKGVNKKRKYGDNGIFDEDNDEERETWREVEFDSDQSREYFKNDISEESWDKQENWHCPICSKSVVADDRVFNEHMDFCLSKDAIREVVHEAYQITQSPAFKRARRSHSKEARTEKDKGKSYWTKFAVAGSESSNHEIENDSSYR